ncbi:DUF2490 domain-containing protein [Bacteroidota bacterium]
MIKKKSLLILFFISFIIYGNAQTVVVKDLEAWTGARIKKELGNNWEISLEEEFRFGHNISELYESYTEAGISYSFNKQWEVGGNYRLVRNRTNSGDFETRQRINADIAYKRKMNRFRLSWRGRIQYLFEPDEVHSVNNFRNKLQLKYNIKNCKFTPYAACELYYRFIKSEGSGFNKLRFTFGTDRSLSKNSEINFFYRIERDLNIDNPKTAYILGLKYDFGF